MNLAELQTKMLEAVTQTGSADPGLDSLIPPARGIRPEMRLDAYRTNVRGAHLKHLMPLIRLPGRSWGPGTGDNF